MVSARIDIKQAPAWVLKLGKQARGAALRGLYSAGLRTVEHIQTSIIPTESPIPVDRGAYRAGWVCENVSGGVLIYNKMPYASIIEYGARAENIKIGRAMIDALTQWVRRKGIGAYSTRRFKGGMEGSKPTLTQKVTLHRLKEPEARQIAWAIAKSMQKNGIFNGGKGLRVLEKALRHAPRFIAEEIARELEQMR
jgi:hypothetical protein